jgi:hypothetical protein
MSRLLLAAPASIVALLATACSSSPAQKLAGHYNGALVLSHNAEEHLNGLGPEGQRAVQSLAAMKLGLDLNKDKTYTLGVVSTDGYAKMSGTWDLDNSDVTLTQTIPIPKATEQPQKLKVDDAGSTLTGDDSGTKPADAPTLTFSRT